MATCSSTSRISSLLQPLVIAPRRCMRNSCGRLAAHIMASTSRLRILRGSASRPQISPYAYWLMSFCRGAPNSPAEDDFALNNWGLVSIMAGRAVLPRRQAFYDRFHDLDSLSPRERARWRAYQRAFIGKLMLIARGRRLVLKSPSHTARVRFLLELFPGAKFIHISRSPGLVFQSNLLLVHTLQRAFALQYPVAGDEQEEIIAREYLATEQRYLTDKASIPTGDLAEVRLQDLSVDPIGELKRIYRELGLSFSVVYERRLPAILAAQGKRSANKHPELSDAQKARVARLEPLVVAFGHDRPTVAMAAPSGPASSSNSWPATNREPVQH